MVHADIIDTAMTASSTRLPIRRAESVRRVAHHFISPEHNFIGHHGQPAGKDAIVASDQIERVAKNDGHFQIVTGSVLQRAL